MENLNVMHKQLIVFLGIGNFQTQPVKKDKLETLN
jgi:hypothetical protein